MSNLDELKPGDVVKIYDNFQSKTDRVGWTGNVDKNTKNFVFVLNQYGDVFKFNKKNQGRIVGYSWPYLTWTLGE